MSPRIVALLLGVPLVVGACRFPELPVIAEDAGDASSDGAMDGQEAPDAAVDAPIDATPVRMGPLVTNNQAADLVIGQPSFGTNGDRGVTAQSFQPDGIAFASGRLWATDYLRNRVLGWDTPTASDPAATHVLGQSTFGTGTAAAPLATTMSQPQDVMAAGTMVVVADGYNRALIWPTLPTTTGQAAGSVLGQPDFVSSAAGTAANQLRTPWSIWTDGNRLLIRGGFTTPRIWAWAAFPTTNGAAADAMLLGGINTTATEFSSSGGVTSDGTRLIVADPANNRVLLWNSIPSTSGTPANLVLGQATFTTMASGSGAAAMNGPTAVLVVDGALLVADGGNDRILVFDPIPTTSGASATQVLGQTTPTGVVLDQAPSDRSVNGPSDLATDGRHLFVADRSNRRILRYTMNLP